MCRGLLPRDRPGDARAGIVDDDMDCHAFLACEGQVAASSQFVTLHSESFIPSWGRGKSRIDLTFLKFRTLICLM